MSHGCMKLKRNQAVDSNHSSRRLHLLGGWNTHPTCAGFRNWLFPKESNFHLTPSEGAGLPLSQGTIKHLAGDERVERSLSVSKTDLLPLQQSPMKGFQSDHNVFRSCIRGLATPDVLFPYSLHFLGFLSEPVNQVYFTCGWLLTQSPFCTACLYRIEK